MTTPQQKALDEIIDNHGFDFIQASDVESWHEDNDDIGEKIQERINEQEVIYYHKAMEYLTENDTSLNNSMQLASDMGYEADKINSELLATLLLQDNLTQKAHKLVVELEAFEFEEVQA